MTFLKKWIEKQRKKALAHEKYQWGLNLKKRSLVLSPLRAPRLSGLTEVALSMVLMGLQL